MTDNQLIRIDGINIKRNYPGMDIFYESSRGLLESIITPRWLYYIKYGNHYVVTFSRSQTQDPDSLPCAEGKSGKILHKSYMAGIHVRHDVTRNLFPIINQTNPNSHYANHLLLEFNNQQEEDDAGFVEDFGSDLVTFINTAASHYVCNSHYPNPIKILDTSDMTFWGSHLYEAISDAALMPYNCDKESIARLFKIHFENFGEDLMNFILKRCSQYHSRMNSRFSETLLLYHSFYDDGYDFLSSYRHV